MKSLLGLLQDVGVRHQCTISIGQRYPRHTLWVQKEDSNTFSSSRATAFFICGRVDSLLQYYSSKISIYYCIDCTYPTRIKRKPISLGMEADSKEFLSSSSSASSYYFIDDDELEYMSLIQDQIQPFFPEFVAAFAKQSPAERELGRCAVVNFAEEGNPHTTIFDNSAELQSYFSAHPFASPTKSTNDPPRRRLFILEDLPCNHILALGSRLRIPPSFFAGHWDDPASSTFNHRDPFMRSTKSHFRLRYATSTRIEVDVPPHMASNSYAFDTNVCRYLHVYNPNGPLYDEPRSHHGVSFWSSSVRDDGSWDAVLLVDPPLRGYVKCLPSRQLLRLRPVRDPTSMPKHFLHPEMTVLEELPLQELPQDSSRWAAAYMRPQYISMFDDTIKILMARDYRDSSGPKEPIDAVQVPRKLVISTLIAYLRRRYLNIVNIQKSRFAPNNTLRHDYLYSFSEGVLSNWHDKLFDFIVGACAAIKEFSQEMEDNIIALGLNTPKGVAARTAPQWEIDGWKSVRDLTNVLEKMINSIATDYLQYVSMQEARVSNSNAQSLSRITVLTMLFIPLSTVASIFSMGDDFLPGKPRAWVFWVVSLPVLMILAYLYWHQQLVRIWTQRRQRILPHSEHEAT